MFIDYQSNYDTFILMEQPSLLWNYAETQTRRYGIVVFKNSPKIRIDQNDIYRHFDDRKVIKMLSEYKKTRYASYKRRAKHKGSYKSFEHASLLFFRFRVSRPVS